MKFTWSLVLCLLIIHGTSAIFKDLFKPRDDEGEKPGLFHGKPGLFGGKPDLFGILKKVPGIPQVNIQLGGHISPGSFGISINKEWKLPGSGVNLPPKDKVDNKPDLPDIPWTDEDKEKVGPRPNWEDNMDDKKPGKPGEDGKNIGDKPFPYEEPGDYYPKPDRKDSLPDWEDIGEDDSKSDRLLDSDLIKDGLIQPRLSNRKRNKRFIESKVYHVPLQFVSDAKPYKVQINPNSLTKGKSKV